jgi:hypothetical protein
MLEQADASTTSASSAHAEQAAGATPAPGAPDVAQLADKVYKLLLADLRLSLARGERLARPGLPRRRQP